MKKMNVWLWGLAAFFGYKVFFKENTNTSYTMLSIHNMVHDLPRHPTKSYSDRSLEQVQQIVLHHSLTNSGSPLAYANYHINTRDFPGIGYHFVIDKDGTIHQTNELTTISYHVSGQNTKSIGICLTGNFDIEYPLQIQISSLVSLIRLLYNQLGYLPLHEHNDYASKSCPGINLSANYISQLI